MQGAFRNLCDFCFCALSAPYKSLKAVFPRKIHPWRKGPLCFDQNRQNQDSRGPLGLKPPEIEGGEQTPHRQDFSLTKKTACFTKGQFRPY